MSSGSNSRLQSRSAMAVQRYRNRQKLRAAGWSDPEADRLDAVTAGAGQEATPPRLCQLAINLTAQGVPVAEALAWVRLMVTVRPDAVAADSPARTAQEVVAYSAVSPGDGDLARAGWAAGIPVPEFAGMIALGLADRAALWALAGLTVPR